MKFGDLKINKQVIYKGKQSTVVHLYEKDKMAVVTIIDDCGKVINLSKVKPHVLHEYSCEYLNGESCNICGVGTTAKEKPCLSCKHYKIFNA